MPIFKWLFLNNLRSRRLGQIQNLDPPPPDVPIKNPRQFQATLFVLGYTPIDRLDPKDGYRW